MYSYVAINRIISKGNTRNKLSCSSVSASLHGSNLWAESVINVLLLPCDLDRGFVLGMAYKMGWVMCSSINMIS